MESRTIAPDFKNAIFTAHGGMCFYCALDGRQQKAEALDHIIPICRGGKTALENLIPACHMCNTAKSGKDLPEDKRGLAIACAARAVPAIEHIASVQQSNKEMISKAALDVIPRETDGLKPTMIRFPVKDFYRIKDAARNYKSRFHVRTSMNSWVVMACLEKLARDGEEVAGG